MWKISRCFKRESSIITVQYTAKLQTYFITQYYSVNHYSEETFCHRVIPYYSIYSESKMVTFSHNFLSHFKQLRTLLPYLLKYLSMLSSNLHGGFHTTFSHVLFNIHVQVKCLCCSSQTHCPY